MSKGASFMVKDFIPKALAMKVTESFQYTFRVDGTTAQYIETAASESEARERVAKIWLEHTGLTLDHPAYEEALRETMTKHLRLVYVR